MSRPYVWQMIKEAIEALDGKATYAEIRDYIRTKFGDVNKSTITCQTIVCSVNHPSRVHYPENKKPRACTSQYDFLFNKGRGKVELYDPAMHGLWELREDEYGRTKTAQQGTIEVGAGGATPKHQTKSSQKRESLKLERPSPELITEYLRKWDKLENYKLQEASLTLLFKELCPENLNIEHVLLKVSALNDFYSTNIFDTFTVAKHILAHRIDPHLKNENYKIVNAIAAIPIKGKTRNFYSFASKYCSHHKPEVFPIYDSFVEKMLLHYRKSDRFYEFEQGDLKKYDQFIKIIRKFKQHYELEDFSLREIDIFLWLAGKETFPKTYSTKRGSRSAR
ncbi:MAG: hypothetical protein PHN84_13640 [Desulfuromonadaceae bacterium]|nr:hypothetical protein [Desulfuromonadaceae bacterium]MDD2856623.1 hypothetical protein [Desulfuromonadaceae bacterium]